MRAPLFIPTPDPPRIDWMAAGSAAVHSVAGLALLAAFAAAMASFGLALVGLGFAP